MLPGPTFITFHSITASSSSISRMRSTPSEGTRCWRLRGRVYRSFVFSCYSSSSTLLHKITLQSVEGVQQGDPLGPLLFCLTIHPLITHLKSEFKVCYLDDDTISGAEAEVLQDFQFIEYQAAHLGLHLNCAKTELICEDPAGSLLFQVAPDLCKVNPAEALPLCSPTG